jgi:BlaI family transcriptional regulator, penicillinase repressor
LRKNVAVRVQDQLAKENPVKRRIVSAFKPHNQGLNKLFGSLEADIISLIWEHGEASARDIFEALRDQGQRLSYGAVKTVLDRLVKKQVLDRAKTGAHDPYTYRALLDREEFTRSAVREIIDSLFASFGEPVYAQFLDQLQEADSEQLERLSQLIDEAEARKKDSQA